MNILSQEPGLIDMEMSHLGSYYAVFRILQYANGPAFDLTNWDVLWQIRSRADVSKTVLDLRRGSGLITWDTDGYIAIDINPDLSAKCQPGIYRHDLLTRTYDSAIYWLRGNFTIIESISR